MSERLRIIHVITKADYGGAQTVVRELAVEQHRNGHSVVVLTGTLGDASAQMQHAGVEVLHEPTLQHAIALRNDRRSFGNVVGTLTSIAPDVVHTHSSKGGLIGRAAAQKLDIPVVYTAHGWPFQKGAPIKQRLLSYAGERWSAFRGGHVVCVTENERRLAERMSVCPPERLHLIYNGLGHIEQPWALAPAAAALETRPLRLVMLARFAAPKRQDLLIEALSDLPNVTIEFAGDGPLMADMQRASRPLGERVRFLGISDASEALQRADVAVLASDYEGLPMSVLEAMRAARPVVVSRLPGLDEVITDGENGALCDNSASAFRSAIRRCVDADARIRLGEGARRTWEQRFTAATMTSKYLDLYRAVVRQ